MNKIQREVGEAVEEQKRTRNVAALQIAMPLMKGEYDLKRPVRIVCECQDPTCAELIKISFKTFVDAAKSDHNFLLLSGHISPDRHKILKKHTPYTLVQLRNPA